MVDFDHTRHMTQTFINDELPIVDFGPIEFYVSNARQAALFYNKLFGFDIVAYKGPETGNRDTASYVLKQNDITFVMTAALTPADPVTQHVARHGDGVRDISFVVEDVEASYQEALRRGAIAISPPVTLQDEHGTVTKATVGTYGETAHTFINLSQYRGAFIPGYKPYTLPSQSLGLKRLDHAVGNVEKEKMDYWANYYQRVFGFYVFRVFDETDISTQYSALASKVMANRAGTIKMPINEPALGLRKSQIEEYLDFYQSAGVQHLALETDDIVATVTELKRRGVQLMTVPESYYEQISDRIGAIHEQLDDLKPLGILIDREENGYLLQIFTQPLQDRPTLFFEIIQRQGAEGFGKGNFQALFEAIERDQAIRGNL